MSADERNDNQALMTVNECFDLAQRYVKGIGVPQDDNKAQELFLTAEKSLEKEGLMLDDES